MTSYANSLAPRPSLKYIQWACTITSVSDPLQICQYPGVAPWGQTYHFKESGLPYHSDPFINQDSRGLGGLISNVNNIQKQQAMNNTYGCIVFWMCCIVIYNSYCERNACRFGQLCANASVSSLSVKHHQYSTSNAMWKYACFRYVVTYWLCKFTACIA